MTNMSTASYTPRHSRTTSPPLSVATPSTVGPQTQRLNVVTRLTVEGNAKRAENVPIKMYMKLALPVDNIVPGSAIPLFKEENVKILESEVHPLDQSSVPYNFSSAASPLLHNAARALNLPARSSHSYLTQFDHRSNASSRFISSPSTSSDADVPLLEEKYTGHILVSGYQVSFVLPSELPPLSKLGSRFENGGDYTPLPTKLRGRRASISEKNVILFMAGISMMVPYLTHPQRAPWLLSIPTPRCLSNTLKLRIFPPESATSSSFQSLSSGEGESDFPLWDMTADPHVTRMTNPRRSTYQYQHFADDESSDSASAPGFSDGFGIQGTFPSTERIRVRWAAPVRSIENGTRAGRRRVGVTDVRGEMLCTISGRGRDRTTGKEGVLVHLDYNGTCQGIWYPGVATLLGMDVGLEATGCDVSWAKGSDSGWEVLGGPGYTGHEIDGAEQPHAEKQTSFDMPTMTMSRLPTPATPNGHTSSRESSISSTSSLLRAPLPPQNVPEYSFESSPTTPGSEAGLSSVFYTTTENNTRETTRASSVVQSESDAPLPSLPITLHLNINDLLPPNKNVFTFSIKGTVLVTPRTPEGDESPHGSDADDKSRGLLISLPRFRILAADSEQIETTARNNIDPPTDVVEVCSSSDPKARKVELVRGARTRVSSRGGFVSLRPLRVQLPRTPVSTQSATRRNSISRPTEHQRTPNLHRAASSSALRETALKPIRDGPLMLPYVHATVTPLSTGDDSIPRAYAACIKLPAPSDADNEWLDFGLGHVSPPQSTEKGPAGPVRVQIVAASLDGVPVKFETTTITKREPSTGSTLVFEQMSGKEWETWVRVRTGTSSCGNVEITYIVNEHNNDPGGKKGKGKGKGKERETAGSGLDIILPSFSIPVGRLQVDVATPSGFEIASVQSNLEHQRSCGDHHELRQFGLREFFYSQICAHIVPQTSPRRSSSSSSRGKEAPPWSWSWSRSWSWSSLPSPSSFLLRATTSAAPALLSLVLLILLLGLHQDLGRLRTSLERCGPPGGPNWTNNNYNVPPVTVTTVTATVVSTRPPAGTSSTARAADPESQDSGSDSEVPLAQNAPASVTMIDVTSPHPPKRDPPRVKPPPSGGGDTSVHGEHDALLPLERPLLLWPIRFDLPFTREEALEAVEHSLSVAWQILRRLYHFPLDPP